MAQCFGKGTFNAPKQSYNANTLLVTSLEGNVYSGDMLASAKWIKGGFLLLANSFIKKADTIQGNPSVRDAKDDLNRAGLLTGYSVEYYKLKADILLPSPTYAAQLVHGHNVSGHKSWTNSEGVWLKNLLT